MKRQPVAQMMLNLAVPIIERCVSMARVEVFVPAELDVLPELLVQAFDGRLVDLDCECETVSVYGCDLSRDLKVEETVALEMAEKLYGIRHRILKR